MSNQIDCDAAEFGSHFKQGGWRLGLLVARSVKVGNHGGSRSSSHVNLKISVAEFATKSGVSESNTRVYFKAWEMAAEEGHCLRAAELNPGDEDASIDFDEDDNESRILWAKFLQKAREPKKPKQQEKKQEKPVEEKTETEEENESSSETITISQEELDAQFRHDRIINAREALETHQTKLFEIGVVTAPEDIAAVQDIITRAEAIAAKGRELLKQEESSS